MRRSRHVAYVCTLLLALALAGCGGSRGGCAASVPLGPVPAGTPIPVQTLPANSGITGSAFVRVDFTVNASGTVTAANVQLSSGSAVVDAAAVKIVESTTFKVIDTNCLGQPVRSGSVLIQFSPNP